MTAHVALIRAVNVGGTGKLPMKEACAALTAAGFSNVRSYIASGNFVFEAQDASGFQEALSSHFNTSFQALCFDRDAFRAHLALCPVEPEKGNQLFAYFCWEQAVVDWDLVQTLKSSTEDLIQKGTVLWLHSPEGMSNSKLADKMAKITGGVIMTARNLNTVRKLNEMLDG